MLSFAVIMSVSLASFAFADGHDSSDAPDGYGYSNDYSDASYTEKSSSYEQNEYDDKDWNGGYENGGTTEDESAEAHLSGSEEVPPVSTDATGHYQMTSENGTAVFALTVQNAEHVTAAHLHCAPPGANGPVVVPLLTSVDIPSTDGVIASGVIDDSDIVDASCNRSIEDVDALWGALEDGEIYVNVHTRAYPNGEIRGQVYGFQNTSDSDGSGSDAMYNDHDSEDEYNDDESHYGGSERDWHTHHQYYGAQHGGLYHIDRFVDHIFDRNPVFNHW